MIPTVGGLAQRVFRILSYSKLLLERRVMKPDGSPPPPPAVSASRGGSVRENVVIHLRAFYAHQRSYCRVQRTIVWSSILLGVRVCNLLYEESMHIMNTTSS